MSRTATSRLEASRRRLQAAQARAASLGDYVQALLVHVNEAAAALRGDAAPRGRVFRVGLAYVTEDNLVVPVPFRRPAPSLFIDQFHVMPLRATSLAPLVASGRGDRIDDLEAHLARRGVSLSTQAALAEGVRSNVRLPWRGLERRGLLWFSADVPRFFDDALFSWLEALVPEVELQLRLLDALEPLLPAAGRPLPLEGSREGLAALARLLEVEENPFPGRLGLNWVHGPRGDGAGLAGLWRLGGRRALLAAADCRGQGVPELRLLLTLRGWLGQLAPSAPNPSLLLERLESRLRAGLAEGALAAASGQVRALALAVLHLDTGQLDHVCLGEARLWLREGGRERPLPLDPLPFGDAPARAAGSLLLGPEAELRLSRGEGEAGLRLRLLPRPA